MAIMTDELPAPMALVELSVCNCTTHCHNNRCKCYKKTICHVQTCVNVWTAKMRKNAKKMTIPMNTKLMMKVTVFEDNI